jgi:hypothetical protein
MVQSGIGKIQCADSNAAFSRTFVPAAQFFLFFIFFTFEALMKM